MYSTSDLKRGLIVDFEGAPHLVETLTVSKPQARGGATIYKVRLRNLKTKTKVDKSFRGGETFGQPDFQKRPVQYLYRDLDTYHFMDSTSYDQFTFERDAIEWELNFLKEEMTLHCFVYNEEVIGLDLPPVVELEITDTAPAARGNSATSRTKPATLESGHVVQVPEHIAPGTIARVDTETGEFLGKAS